MKRRGFTIVELVIVIAIMGILLVLAVVNLRSTQVNGRDDERKADIEAIALNLETYYKSGTDTSTTFDRYPSTTTLVGHELTVLRDIDPKSLATPGTTASGLVAASSNIKTGAGSPQPSISQYVYQPLRGDGSLCTDETIECRQFNLYYQLEGDNIVYSVTSKNQ